MAALTRLGLHGGPRGLYGDFSGKAASAVQMSGSTGWATTPTGAIDQALTLVGSTGWTTTPTGALDVEAALAGSTGWAWNPTGDLVDADAVVPSTSKTGGRSKRKRYVVEVDGQLIEVPSILAAQAVLSQVRELAEESAEQDVTSHVTPKPPRVAVKTISGMVTTSKVIQREVKRTQQVINRAYIEASKRREVDIQISTLLQQKIQFEDEEDSILALLM